MAVPISPLKCSWTRLEGHHLHHQKIDNSCLDAIAILNLAVNALGKLCLILFSTTWTDLGFRGEGGLLDFVDNVDLLSLLCFDNFGIAQVALAVGALFGGKGLFDFLRSGVGQAVPDLFPATPSWPISIAVAAKIL